MRVGIVVKILYDKKFGFIRAENLRSDVLFRFSVVAEEEKPHWWEVGQEVEFDLDELKRLEFKDLEAAKVQRARRPISHKLNEFELPGMTAAHHPKARRRKPIWRKDEDPEGTKLASENPDSENATSED
jgi:cold shock CspA family protein